MKPPKDNAITPSESGLTYDTKIPTLRGIMPIGEIVNNQKSCRVFTIHESGVAYHQRVEQWHDRSKQEIFEYALNNGATM